MKKPIESKVWNGIYDLEYNAEIRVFEATAAIDIDLQFLQLEFLFNIAVDINEKTIFSIAGSNRRPRGEYL